MLHENNPLWKDWNVLTREALIRMQQKEGPSAGCWVGDALRRSAAGECSARPWRRSRWRSTTATCPCGKPPTRPVPTRRRATHNSRGNEPTAGSLGLVAMEMVSTIGKVVEGKLGFLPISAFTVCLNRKNGVASTCRSVRFSLTASFVVSPESS